MSFKNISEAEYDRLVRNKNRTFDMTFKTPEVLNRYRNNKNVYNEIKQNEKQNKKLENYDKVFHENLNKYFIENEDEKKIEEVSRCNYNIIKKEKEIGDRDNELKSKDDEIRDKDDKIIDLRNTYIKNRYGNRYKLDNDINILKSFETIFNENDIPYNSYKKQKKHKSDIFYIN